MILPVRGRRMCDRVYGIQRVENETCFSRLVHLRGRSKEKKPLPFLLYVFVEQCASIRVWTAYGINTTTVTARTRAAYGVRRSVRFLVSRLRRVTKRRGQTVHEYAHARTSNMVKVRAVRDATTESACVSGDLTCVDGPLRKNGRRDGWRHVATGFALVVHDKSTREFRPNDKTRRVIVSLYINRRWFSTLSYTLAVWLMVLFSILADTVLTVHKIILL